MPNIAILNQSTVCTDAEIQQYTEAIQVQVSRDFAHYYRDARLVFVPKGSQPPAGAWWMVILDNSDQAGALGYHDLTPEGLPSGKVFAATDKQYGQKVSVTFSHEILEMIADPWVNLTTQAVTGSGAKQVEHFFAYEVCDAVEADELGYPINGVTVSDFVLPAWFIPGLRNTRYSFQGHVHAPLALAPGGYIGVLNIRTSAGWTQITADGVPHRTGNAAPLGSRRERRKAGHDVWRLSSAQH